MSYDLVYDIIISNVSRKTPLPSVELLGITGTSWRRFV